MINEEPFIQWLDKQIAIATTWTNAAKPHEVSVEADRFRIRAKVLQDVKKKFDELYRRRQTIEEF